MEADEAVKIFTKLPGWFKVPTPLGTYNPDWAVLVDCNGKEKLYFVVETNFDPSGHHSSHCRRIWLHNKSAR